MPHGEGHRQPRRAWPGLLPLLLAAACSPLGWPGAEDRSLARYHDAFVRAVGDRFTAAARTDDLVRALAGRRVLWLGDDHRHGPLHGRQRQLLGELRRHGLALALGLEAIGTQDQAAVDAFLRGEAGIDALAEQLRRRWPGSWLHDPEVDHEHHRELLRQAQAAGEPVFALEPTPRLPLPERDAAIAAAVQAAAARHPERLLVVLVGQSHLLGDGDLIARTALPATAIGAVPPWPLWQAAATRAPDRLLHSAGGLWFFADLVPEPR